jgi:SSS family solute:Na+ symporter
VVLCQIAAYPFIVLIVGWFLIPFIMKLGVTSAYEILEARLGLSVRMLGSVFFLFLRLLWMAVIIYATTSKVLIPLLGLDAAATPWICGVMGAVTVLYTSMGGLRAVVYTDVVQSIILLCGAVLTFVVITVQLGGVGGWWPTGWDPNWTEAQFWFDPSQRTFMGAFLAALTWYVCTAGSDQMAVQRYLATRDTKSARRAFATSMSVDATVILFMMMLGLALLAYFRAHPFMIPDGYTIESNPDQLFPQFIVFGLPVGISGLVVAGLLAAAMSSLSSGINSSSSVITIDFMDRFRRRAWREAEHIRMARYVSVMVGALVVGLSFYVSLVEGNLLEVAYKVANLLVAPLFVLFFLAMFIPWATSLGTVIAAGCSVAVAVGIAYFEMFGLSFLWIMPCALVTGVVVGMLASCLPVGRKPDHRRNSA